MRKGLMVPAVVIGLALAGVSGGVALAAGDGDQEASVAANMQVPLAQAIATAEQHTGGKAYDAGVAVNGGQNQYVVETNGPKGAQTVVIDGASGKVVGGHAGGEPD